MSKYKVDLYYTGYITHEIEADSPSEAIQKARDIQGRPCSQEEFRLLHEPILETLEPWKECDSAEEVE